jgi:hypothetical protein
MLEIARNFALIDKMVVVIMRLSAQGVGARDCMP